MRFENWGLTRTAWLVMCQFQQTIEIKITMPYATPRIRLILPGCTKFRVFTCFTTGQINWTCPPPRGGAPRLDIWGQRQVTTIRWRPCHIRAVRRHLRFQRAVNVATSPFVLNQPKYEIIIRHSSCEINWKYSPINHERLSWYLSTSNEGVSWRMAQA
jgi:hypothetical protein